MASILFVDYQTVIPASWLNDVNAMVYSGTVPANTLTVNNLVVNTSLSGSGVTALFASPPAIGGTSANTGAFTALSASSSVTLSGGTANGVAYLNGSKVLTTGSALTFDGTNLGVGTSSFNLPGTNRGLLEVNGTSDSIIGWKYNNTVAGYIQGSAAALNINSSSSTSLYLTAGSTQPIVFQPNSTERMRIDSSGNLLINTTSAVAGSKLVVASGDANINGLTVGKGGGSVASNTANGFQALYYNTTGVSNTANGMNALLNNTTGSGNTAINPLNSAGSYAPVFDPTTENNRFCMGSTGVTNAYIQVAWTVVSDARDKTDFATVPHGLDFVTKLSPTAYRYKMSRDSVEGHGPVRYGFKAQDVLALEGDNPVIVDAEDADKLRFNDQSMLAVLVNAIKELNAKIEAQAAEIKLLKGA